MTRCSTSFSIVEMLALIKGDFEKIENFASRIKEILTSDMNDRKMDSKMYANFAIDKLSGILMVPDELKQKMIPIFDPKECTCEILRINNRLSNLIDIVCNSGSDAELQS